MYRINMEQYEEGEILKEQITTGNLPQLKKQQQYCHKHQFCNNCFQFNDQTQILRPLNQPSNPVYGDQLPIPNNEDQKLNPVKELNFVDITEQALDDWIAQSLNRPIVSFLDPYKRFNTLQSRYRRLVKSKQRDFQQQMLYFDDRVPQTAKQRLYQPTRRPQNKYLDLTFKYQKLVPHQLDGTNIQQRQDFTYTHLTHNGSIDSTMLDLPGNHLEFDSIRPLPNRKRNVNYSYQQYTEGVGVGATSGYGGRSSNNNSGQNILPSITRSRNTHQGSDGNLMRMLAGSPAERSLTNSNSPPSQTVNTILNDQSNQNISYSKNLLQNSNTNHLNQIKTPVNSGVNQYYDSRSRQNNSISSNDVSFNLGNQNITLTNVLKRDGSITPKQGHYIPSLNINHNDHSNASSGYIVGTGGNNSSMQQGQGGTPTKSQKIASIFFTQAQQEARQSLTFKVDKILSRDGAEQGKLVPIQIQSLAIHLEETLTRTEKKEKAQMNNVEFSFYRAVRRFQKGTIDAAIACLHQTLLVDKLHFPSIFNLAVLNERTKNFETAQKWAEIGLEILSGGGGSTQNINSSGVTVHQYNFEQQELLMCVAVCAYKNMKFRECYEIVADLIKTNDFQKAEKLAEQNNAKISKNSSEAQILSIALKNEQSENDPTKEETTRIKTLNDIEKRSQQLYYLKSLCAKHLGKVIEATAAYSKFIQSACPKNFMVLMHFMFAIVFKKLRGLEIQFDPLTFVEINTLLGQILHSEQFKPILNKFYDNGVWKGHDEAYQTLLDTFGQLSFFCRFDRDEIQQNFPNFYLKHIEQESIIFPQKDEIIIITSGKVTVYDHSKNFQNPEIVAYYGQGDIIGSDDQDNKTSSKPDIWFVANTDIEYIAMRQDQFNAFWKLQHNQNWKMEIHQAIAENVCLQGVSELTLYKFAFQLVKQESFNKGDIVFNDSQCIEKHHYIQLKKVQGKGVKNVVDRINKKISKFDYSQQIIQGFYIIQAGKCQLETPNQWTQHIFHPDDFVGETLMFNSISMTRFGRVVAKSQTVQTYFLPREQFGRFTNLDQDQIKSNIKNSPYFKHCQNQLYKFYQIHQDFQD